MEGEPEIKRKNKNLVTMTVRVYGQGDNSCVSHGYIVDDAPTGMSPPVGALEVDAKTTKLSEIRDKIEYNRTGHMNRRTIMFQETLFIMSRLPNYYDRPKEQLTKWQFGYVQKGSENVKMIHLESENKTLFASIPDLFNTEIVIVPLSQVPPEFDGLPPHGSCSQSGEEEHSEASVEKMPPAQAQAQTSDANEKRDDTSGPSEDKNISPKKKLKESLAPSILIVDDN